VPSSGQFPSTLPYIVSHPMKMKNETWEANFPRSRCSCEAANAVKCQIDPRKRTVWKTRKPPPPLKKSIYACHHHHRPLSPVLAVYSTRLAVGVYFVSCRVQTRGFRKKALLSLMPCIVVDLVICMHQINVATTCKPICTYHINRQIHVSSRKIDKYATTNEIDLFILIHAYIIW
jgi:hypothetical protein